MKQYCRLWALLALLVCTSYAVNAQRQESTVVVQQGLADLRQLPLADHSYSLEGQWKFAWNQLITPANYDAFNSYVQFPHLWNNVSYNGQQLPAKGYASYGLTVLLPSKRSELALYMPCVYSSYALYLNGEIIASNGKPATNKAGYEAKWVPVTVSLPVHVDTMQFVLQVVNFSHSKGGPNLSLKIGDQKLLILDRERNLSIDFLLCGCLFMGGLFFLGLYRFGTRDKATFYFSLFCLTYSYRMVGSSLYALHVVFPQFNWELAVRMEYISLFSSIYLFVKYVAHLYPDEVHRYIMQPLTMFCTGCGLLTILTPADIFTQIISPFLAMMFFCIGYLLMVFVKAYLNKRVAAKYALMSIAALMVVQLVLNLEYFGIIVPSREVLFAGYVIFFFLQSLILSFRFAYTLQLAKSQAEQGLQAKSEFLSTMSHEIRTPLNSVIGITNLIKANHPRPDQKEQLEVLQFSANNLLSIVNDILDYNKIEAGKVRFERIETDLPDLLGKTVEGLRNAADEKQIALTLSVDPAIDEYVLGDPMRLTQVMNNLVSNAVKFTKVGGVTVTVKLEQRSSQEQFISFSVADTGIGIAPEKQQLIFEEFTQADSSTSRGFGGTGLGLAITKKILALQGSQLALDSEPGKGSTFSFILKFTATGKLLAKPIAATIAAPLQQALSGMQVLLVEDNPINVLVARSFLEGWGATIDVAENGELALQRLDVQRHQIILMDLHMPVMDGYTAIELIRSKGIRIPIIALTASLPGEVEQEVKGLDIDEFVLKPFVPEELYAKISQLAGKSKHAVASLAG